MTGVRRATWLAVGALAVAVAAVLAITVGPGGEAYIVKAQFHDAGQLVRGGQVHVAVL